jgi:CheY-like chemotaxis protein
MRLLIVGTLNGQLTTATKIAMDRGATVTHASDIAQAMAVLRSGRGADLLMVDVGIAIRDLVTGLEATRRSSPAAPRPMPAPRSPPSRQARKSTSRCRRTRN